MKNRILLAAMGLIGILQAGPIGIVGGDGSDNPYEALISPDAVATPITGVVPTGLGEVLSVAINNFGYSVVGGRQGPAGTTPYVALISPEGVATSLTGSVPAAPGQIQAVDINDSRLAIIGGRQNTNIPYVVFVNADGVAISLSGAVPTGTGGISSVSINNSGFALIGGSHNVSQPYAGLVSPQGFITAITNSLVSANGNINSVSINESGSGIIGGVDNATSLAFMILVDSNGVGSPITGFLPQGNGRITAVSINDSGKSIVGGRQNGNTTGYVALVSPSGVASQLTGFLPSGTSIIDSVSINNSGAAIIGGFHMTNLPYVALVSPNGIATALTGQVPTGSGEIVTVSISDSGAALIGGNHNGNTPYMGLVAPSGIVTSITGVLPVGNGRIESVDILKQVAPKSFGPGSSFANALFALSSQILPNHAMIHHKSSFEESQSREIGLLADAKDTVRWVNPCCDDKTYIVWGALFGEYAHQKKVRHIPKLTNWIAGTMIGLDYLGICNTVIGGGAAYAYDYVDISQGVGHSHFNEGFLTIYGSWNRRNFFINAALWGGYYGLSNTRHTLGIITSKANTHGWLLSPHLEMSMPFDNICPRWFILEPFIMFDWANNWQNSFHETGSSGFNLHMKDQYTSLLRSELGFRFYETLQYGWGRLILEEKASYVNKKPFHTGNASAFFTGASSTFGVEVFSNQTQNLGVVQLNASFIPCNRRYVYGSINYQGEFGSSFQSHLLSLEIGKNF